MSVPGGGLAPYGSLSPEQLQQLVAALRASYGLGGNLTPEQEAEQRAQYEDTIRQAGLEDIRRYDQNYGLQASAQRDARRQHAADLAYRYKALKQQGRNEEARLLLDTELGRGRLGVEQGRLGLDTLRTAVDYASTPDNYFKLSDFAQGVNQRQDVPVFVSNLLNGVGSRQFGQPGGVPTPHGMGGLGGALSTAGYQQDQSALGAIGQVGAQGGGALRSAAFNSLGDTDQRLLVAGLARKGYDPSRFLQEYDRSRLGQTTALG